MSIKQEKIGYKELAILAMQMCRRPMTPSELWNFVLDNNLHYRLDTFDPDTGLFKGKTPEATFGARIYSDKTDFESVPHSKPKQFILKQGSDNSIAVNNHKKNVVQMNNLHRNKSDFCERDLHPVLSYFLKNNDYFNAYPKTIFHEGSSKGSRGEDKWLYPDMVAVNFEYANYQKNNVLSFIQKFDKPPIKIFSFEIKKGLNFSNYKESFFQAVSNSSWSHEGYLVALEIKKDNQFLEALQKLSQSFGIGVIELDLENIQNSNVLSPAKFKESMDYSVVDELANKNPNFAQFLKTITDFDVANSDRFKSEFDEILTEHQYQAYLKERFLKCPTIDCNREA